MRETFFKLDTIPQGRATPLVALGLAVPAISFVFIVFPGIDLAVSSWFADGDQFPLSENSFLKALRDFNRAVPYWLLPLMVIAIIAFALWPRRLSFLAAHKALYVVLSFAMGPGLLVQTGKTLFGRPRPTGIIEFGGMADFTPVWQFASLCSHSCSFPSGEAALAAATMSVLVFIPAASARLASMALTLFLLVVSLNRVLFGAHFLSDVLIGWFGTLWVMAWLWGRIALSADRIDDAIRRAGMRARRAISFSFD